MCDMCFQNDHYGYGVIYRKLPKSRLPRERHYTSSLSISPLCCRLVYSCCMLQEQHCEFQVNHNIPSAVCGVWRNFAREVYVYSGILAITIINSYSACMIAKRYSSCAMYIISSLNSLSTKIYL